tara:strand:+ start:167 stop:340 length:174 start_codon:yes stop_codon:yes gene_type:complete
LASNDSVDDVNHGQPTVDALNAHGVDAEFVEIYTPYGHTGFMLDAKKWADKLEAFFI